MNRHSRQYPKTVIILQARVAAYARTYRETPSEETLATFVELKQAFLREKAKHHVELARMFREQAKLVDGEELRNAVSIKKASNS